MPELPEVETVAAGLRPLLVGRVVTGCDVRFPTVVRYPDPAHFACRLTGRKVVAVGRRGKYILVRLDGPLDGAEDPENPIGPGDLLVMHLGMTGELRVAERADAEPDHLHAVFTLDDGHELRYRDPRRFGRLLLGTSEELVREGKMPLLGPEPLDPQFTSADLYRRLHRRRAPLKAVLLDQRVVAGVGNIYADESCFLARIRPDRPAASLSRPAVGRLRQSLEAVLGEAITNRGSTVVSYRDTNGEAGRQQERLLVYGRAGEPCFRCGRPLSQSRLAGRTTVFCRRCQR
jgi:formamidopyrimidine-DNA glycosylase